MKSTEINSDILTMKNELSMRNAQLQETIEEYRNTLIEEGVKDILQVIKEDGSVSERELRLILNDVVRKCLRVQM